MRRLAALTLAAGLMAPAAHAQDVSVVPPVTTADPGQLFPNDPLVRAADPGLNPQGPRPKATRASAPPAAAPGRTLQPDPAKLEVYARTLRPEYDRRVKRDGQASADRWLRAVAHELGRRDGQAARAGR